MHTVITVVADVFRLHFLHFLHNTLLGHMLISQNKNMNTHKFNI